MSVTLNASNSGSGGFIVTPDSSGVLAFQTAGTTALTLDTNQNMGLGVTPASWYADANGRALQIRSAGIYAYQASSNHQAHFVSNTYLNTSAAWTYIDTDYALRYTQASGQHLWFNASGTAGNPVTFTQAMTLDANGNLGIGTTTPTSTYSARVAIVPFTSNAALSVDATSGYNTGINFYNNAVLKWSTQVLTTGEYRWYDFTATAERARIDSSGNLLVGSTTSPSAGSGQIIGKALFLSSNRVVIWEKDNTSSNVISATVTFQTTVAWYANYIKFTVNSIQSNSSNNYAASYLYAIGTSDGNAGTVRQVYAQGDSAQYTVTVSGNSGTSGQIWTVSVTGPASTDRIHMTLEASSSIQIYQVT